MANLWEAKQLPGASSSAHLLFLWQGSPNLTHMWDKDSKNGNHPLGFLIILKRKPPLGPKNEATFSGIERKATKPFATNSLPPPCLGTAMVRFRCVWQRRAIGGRRSSVFAREMFSFSAVVLWLSTDFLKVSTGFSSVLQVVPFHFGLQWFSIEISQLFPLSSFGYPVASIGFQWFGSGFVWSSGFQVRTLSSGRPEPRVGVQFLRCPGLYW